MTTGTNAAKPPFTQGRELYAELFEADNLETAMWHFSQMKPSEQRFIQAHLLYLLLHGQAVTNLNLRDIRARLDEFETRLQQEEEEQDEESPEEQTRQAPAQLRDSGPAEVDDEEDEVDEEHSGDTDSDREPELPPQLQAAVSALEEALTYDREGNAAVAQEAR